MEPSPASSARSGRGARGLALGCLAALAAWPFLATLGYWPMTADPATWIGSGTPLSQDWLHWVFAGDHYSWYRPVTALSFALGESVSGLNPWAFRITDLALHLLVGGLASAVFRRWTPGASPWSGVLVAAIVWLHPIAEQVVPYMARRSYSLSTGFGLAALWVLWGTTERARAGTSSLAASAGTGALLVLALLSNESALMVVLVAPLLAATRLGTRAWRALLPAGALVALALCGRAWVLGGLGGYGPLAGGPDQAPRWAEVLLPLIGDVTGLGALWPRLAAADLGWLGATIFGGFLGGYYLTVARRREHAGAPAVHPLLRVSLIWLALAALLYAAVGIYTSRQAYGLQVPLAFAVAGAWSARRSLLDWLAPVLLLGVLLLSAPAWHGQQPQRLAGWAARQALLEALTEDLAACREPAVVRLVLPNMRPGAPVVPASGDAGASPGSSRLRLHRSIRQPAEWLEVVLRGREVAARDYLYYPRDGAPVRYDRREGRPVLLLPPAGPLYRRQGRDFAAAPESGVLGLDELSWPPGTHRYLYLYTAGGGRLVSLGRAR